jgi:hypothetical protein
LAAQRTRFAQQLSELEIAERVLTRFGGQAEAADRRRSVAASARRQRRPPGGPQPPSVSLSDATLRAVMAFGGGVTANDVMNYLMQEFGMAVRPNHLGIALQRHRRAGRLENRDQRWFLAGSQKENEASAMSA